MKRILIFSLTVILATLSATATPQNVKDSLLRVLHTQPHDSTRLMTIHALARLDQSNPSFLHYEDLLLKEAVSQQNIKYQCIAMHNHVIYYFNHNDKQHAQQWMARLSQIAPQHGFYNLYFDAKRWLIELHFTNEEVEIGIHEAQKMAAEAQAVNNVHGEMSANLCLLTGYLWALQKEKALEIAQRIHALLSPNDETVARMNTLVRLMSTYLYLRNDEGVLKSINDLENTYQEINPALRSAYSNVLMSIESTYVTHYLHHHQPDEARTHLDLMESHYNPNFYLSTKIDRFNAYVDYYRYVKEYDRALTMCDSIILLTQAKHPAIVVSQNVKRANILIDANRIDEAFPLYQSVIAQSDSLNRAVSKKQMEQIQSIYNVDKLLLEKEVLKGEIYAITLSVAGVLLILLVIYTLHSHRTKVQLALAEKETREATHITEEINEVKNRFLSNLSYNIRIPLNNVVGFSQLIAADPDIKGAMLKDYTKIIQKNSNELIQMVNDVLDLSRLEAKMMRFNLSHYTIQDLCQDAIGQVQMHHSAVQITLRDNHIEDGHIYIDVNRIGLVLASLLNYPVPYEVAREVVIELTKADNTYTLTVRNTPMADPEFATQTVAIRHEINRLMVEHFGGTYQLKEAPAEEATVIFTIPGCETPKIDA